MGGKLLCDTCQCFLPERKLIFHVESLHISPSHEEVIELKCSDCEFITSLVDKIPIINHCMVSGHDLAKVKTVWNSFNSLEESRIAEILKMGQEILTEKLEGDQTDESDSLGELSESETEVPTSIPPMKNKRGRHPKKRTELTAEQRLKRSEEISRSTPTAPSQFEFESETEASSSIPLVNRKRGRPPKRKTELAAQQPSRQPKGISHPTLNCPPQFDAMELTPSPSGNSKRFKSEVEQTEPDINIASHLQSLENTDIDSAVVGHHPESLEKQENYDEEYDRIELSRDPETRTFREPRANPNSVLANSEINPDSRSDQNSSQGRKKQKMNESFDEKPTKSELDDPGSVIPHKPLSIFEALELPAPAAKPQNDSPIETQKAANQLASSESISQTDEETRKPNDTSLDSRTEDISVDFPHSEIKNSKAQINRTRFSDRIELKRSEREDKIESAFNAEIYPDSKDGLAHKRNCNDNRMRLVDPDKTGATSFYQGSAESHTVNQTPQKQEIIPMSEFLQEVTSPHQIKKKLPAQQISQHPASSPGRRKSLRSSARALLTANKTENRSRTQEKANRADVTVFPCRSCRVTIHFSGNKKEDAVRAVTHVLSHHPPIKTFGCKICKYVAIEREEMERHAEMMHPQKIIREVVEDQGKENDATEICLRLGESFPHSVYGFAQNLLDYRG